ncbi:sporulation histidine kinase inhibitor Sda [Cohnella suwonensis]|uniref:Sporulation histidine kinase inhibitor Sda n=1 Tax=Cohnella suwonensis TaxID=696072 RepID=A0ABW0M3C6_9BACL
MSDRTYPYLVNNSSTMHSPPIATRSFHEREHDSHIDMVAARRLSDKASLLRPLKDEHLLEVYREAKKMNLSVEFIELLEEALSIRQMHQYKEA